jgi:hypothetical protein
LSRPLLNSAKFLEKKPPAAASPSDVPEPEVPDKASDAVPASIRQEKF